MTIIAVDLNHPNRSLVLCRHCALKDLNLDKSTIDGYLAGVVEERGRSWLTTLAPNTPCAVCDRRYAHDESGALCWCPPHGNLADMARAIRDLGEGS